MVEITQVNQDLITALKAKLQYAENLLSDLEAKKSVAVEAENKKYQDALKVIGTTYATQIASLKTDISNLKIQLEKVI